MRSVLCSVPKAKCRARFDFAGILQYRKIGIQPDPSQRDDNSDVLQ